MTSTVTLTKPRSCEQTCGHQATVYAIDPVPGGWGGYYCQRCADDLKFQVVDHIRVAATWTLRTNPGPEADRFEFPVDEWQCETCTTPIGFTLWENGGGWIDHYESNGRKVCYDCLPADENHNVCDICRQEPDRPLEQFPIDETCYTVGYEPTAVLYRLCRECADMCDENQGGPVVAHKTLTALKAVLGMTGLPVPSDVKIVDHLADEGFIGKW